MKAREELIKERLLSLRAKLLSAKLVAVSKYTDIESVEMAIKFQQFDFGENRVEELEKKSTYFSRGDHQRNIRWHFLGHLQNNKIKKLLEVPNLEYIHSVDSLKKVKEIIKKNTSFDGNDLKLFLQVKTSDEVEKSGFSNLDELSEAIEFLKDSLCSKIRFYGLMTMGKIRTDHFEEDARSSFLKLQTIKKNLEDKHNLSNIKLSMGMSQDFSFALDYDSDYVRIGTAIFK